MAGQGDGERPTEAEAEAEAEAEGGGAGDGVERARARSAAGAAAADFDPLRIRPYVSLPDPAGSSSERPEEEGVRSFAREGDAPIGAGTEAEAGTGTGTGTGTKAHADLHGNADADAEPHEKRSLRKRPLPLLALAGAVTAVTAATVFAVGLLSSAADGPTRDRALPDDLTSAYADPTKPAAPSANAPASSSRTPSAPPSVRPSQSPSSTRSSTAPPSSSPPSSGPPSTARATGSVGTSASPPRGTADVTVRQGDKGAQVRELQDRLAQLYLYVGERDGSYTSEVTAAVRRYQWARGLRDDPQGEYGRETRRSLESETTEPG
ncbi:peptidoglycan-binding domain-containing protein [Streptomyces sp. PA5.6]|uniref:peptidoglycan-binding domain-containing protein n=1 Tax=Streptomyces sp. PA5.6 TaxID=3035651 RepID=UPI00390473E5